MDALVLNVGLVERLRAAAASLERACRGVQAEQEVTNKGGRVQAVDCGAALREALLGLRKLLHELPALPAGPSTADVGAAHDNLWPSGTSTAAARHPTLLQLPDDILARVARCSGSASLAVCSRLLHAYGCPSQDLGQPRAGFELHPQLAQHPDYGYGCSRMDMLAELLGLVVARQQSQFSLHALASYSARWPTGAAQVTRLVLSDVYEPGADALRLVQQALPGLQQLELAVGPGAQALPSLPPFPHVTQLHLVCSSHSLVNLRDQHTDTQAQLLRAMPNLRGLHLDRRFQRPCDFDALRAALQTLARLTHLELVQGPDEDIDEDVGAVEGTLRALQSSVGQLQSLVLLAPPDDHDAGLIRALRAMTRLTRLSFCIGSDLPRRGIVVDPLQARSVRQLVLAPHTPDRQTRVWDRTVTAFLALALCGRVEQQLALESLVLPVVSERRPHDVAMLATVQAILEGVANRCPALTSLRCGSTFANDASEEYSQAFIPQPDQHWLHPVGGMQQLQQLVLTSDASELDALACLAPLPLLTELWLSTASSAWLQARLQHDAYQPGSGLAQLASLKLLALRTPRVAANLLALPLLTAAASLPRLEVLDVSAAAAFTADEEAWRPLAASPPPSLQALRLGPGRASHFISWLPAHQRTLALLQRHLPQHVKVSVAKDTGRDPYATQWGPLPEILMDVLMD